jgi:hypothetical protein
MQSESTLNPLNAWQPWTPSESEPWNRGRASLLFRRGGFGANEQQLRDAVKREPQEVVADLVSRGVNVEKSSSFEKESASLASSIRASGDMTKLASWWLHRMLNSPAPIIE